MAGRGYKSQNFFPLNFSTALTPAAKIHRFGLWLIKDPEAIGDGSVLESITDFLNFQIEAPAAIAIAIF